MNETSHERRPTLGEIHWAAQTAAIGFTGLPWDTMTESDRAGIEAGAQAVANAAIQRRIDELDAQAEPLRYALVEQMGHRSTIASVREATFCGQPMLELTNLKTGAVHLVAPQSLYEVTWLTESDARARAKPWTAVALPAGQDDDDDDDDLDYDDGRDDGMSAAEKDAYDREGEAWLDAQDEACGLELERAENGAE